ncbi:MAG TPA: hypothetical protein VFP95_07460, partial [Gammaproteobacteria bacterium]|nr:hypothetical protein [Gammaproteobacteria bacterium]
MQIRSGLCLVLLALLECSFAIQAAPASDQVTLEAVFPASPAQLLPDESVHFKLHYTSAQPARIWVRPYT